MRKLIVILILGMVLATCLPAASATEGIPVPSTDFIRKMLLLPDNDFTIFDKYQLCTAFLYLIDTDDNDLVVKNAVASLWITEDERAVPYLIDNLENYSMHALYGLGHFSTVDSCEALLKYINDEDEFNRRFSAQSLGQLDYTVSDEMWELRDDVLAGLTKRLSLEEENWIIPFLEKSIAAIDAQIFINDNGTIGN
jgi:hypothetical protein